VAEEENLWHHLVEGPKHPLQHLARKKTKKEVFQVRHRRRWGGEGDGSHSEVEFAAVAAWAAVLPGSEGALEAHHSEDWLASRMASPPCAQHGQTPSLIHHRHRGRGASQDEEML